MWIFLVANDRKEVRRGQVTLRGGPFYSVLPERLECSMISDDYMAAQQPLVAKIPAATYQHTAVQSTPVVSKIIDYEVHELTRDAIGDVKRKRSLLTRRIASLRGVVMSIMLLTVVPRSKRCFDARGSRHGAHTRHLAAGGMVRANRR